MELAGGVRLADAVTLGALASHVPIQEVRAAIKEAGREGVRNRLLTSELTMLFVIAMSLYRDVSYVEVLRCLFEGFRRFGNSLSRVIPTKGAVTQARDRLGFEAVQGLFRRIARPMADKKAKGAWYRGLRTVALDGSTLDVYDSPSNVAAFGYPPASRGNSAFPKIKFVALCETGTHAAFACEMGSYTVGEAELSLNLFESLKPGMLLLADRGFLSYELWDKARATGADLLWRVSSTWTLSAREMLGDGSWIARIRPQTGKRRTEREIAVRVVEYSIEGSAESYRLVTTLLAPEEAPAEELAALYHERWEVESMFDEMKTHLKGSRVVLRSKTPDLVRQEFWGMMLAHRALRELMYEAAFEKGWDPDVISTVHAIRLVRRTMASAAALPP
jgi:hypothetical protein